MKSKLLLGLLALIAISFAACKKNNGCSRSEKAWVMDLSDSDSCGLVFRLEDNTLLEATNVNEFQNFENGDLVWISYKETAGASLCKLGTIVKIRCLTEREF
ncbi:hypothetical protein [Crocinitomix catalasitica]|uniref:hypothetical protein n=1 Tax=Crocinitomix catalasitica TaxID=184607 RepID=UPI000483EA79|nr:hypothetical protein [Crocinitomix catalasitica]